MSDISNLKDQIYITIKALKLKKETSNESILDGYIDKYLNVLKVVDSGGTALEVYQEAKYLLNCARGYMEISSDYQQDFLIEMGKTEQIVKVLVG